MDGVVVYVVDVVKDGYQKVDVGRITWADGDGFWIHGVWMDLEYVGT